MAQPKDKEPTKTYQMYSGPVEMTRSERMSHNYIPGLDRAVGTVSYCDITRRKEFYQTREERDRILSLLREVIQEMKHTIK